MSTINKTKNKIKKITFYSLSFLFILACCVAVYMYYGASGSCRVLEKISGDTEMNNALRVELSKYLRLPQVQSELENTFDGAFSVRDFNPPMSLPKSITDLDINFNNDIQIFIKIDRKDRRFVDPFNIQTVGVGYSRAYLMFDNIGSGEPLNTGFDVDLKTDSYVDCRVYD